MTRALLVLVPLAAVLAALAGTAVSWPLAITIGFALGTVVAATAGTVQERRLTRFARDVNSWLAVPEHEPVRPPRGRAWAQLAVAVNALGAAYDRRGQRLVTERRVREEVVDALPEPALMFDDDGYLLRANAPACGLFGIDARDRLTATQTFGSAELAAGVEESIALGRGVEVDTALDDRELSALAVPIADAVLVVIRDRTEQRRVDAVRRDFVANASHELKTPVAGLQALADALEVTLDRDAERARSLVGRVRSEAQRLSKLVHDLLDLRRLEEGSPLAVSPVDIVELIAGEITRVEAVAVERGVEVDAELPPHAVVAGVEEDLRLVVANLLNNAVGYNERGGSVTVRLAQGPGTWDIVVADTGIGLARHDLDRIFERFYRVDVARSRETGGTGLGLSIVRNAVERHGGALRVDSVLGEGSTFRVTLPVEPPAGRSR